MKKSVDYYFDKIWDSSTTLFILFVIIVASLMFGQKSNAQISRTYIGNNYYSVFADVKRHPEVTGYLPDVYHDGSMSIVASYKGDKKIMYAFDTNKVCILCFAIMPLDRYDSVVSGLDGMYYKVPFNGYKDRWVDWGGLQISVWKIGKDIVNNKMYLFVMTVQTEQFITDYFESKLTYIH